MKYLLPALLCAGTLVASLPEISIAQSNPGFSFIWGGDGPSQVEPLSYVLEYGTPGHLNDHYRLKVGPQAATIESIVMTLPKDYQGRISPKNISLIARRGRASTKPRNLPIKSIEMSEDQSQLRIIPETPIPQKTVFVAEIKNVQNPESTGEYPIHGYITLPGDVTMNSYIGSWVMTIK